MFGYMNSACCNHSFKELFSKIKLLLVFSLSKNQIQFSLVGELVHLFSTNTEKVSELKKSWS